MGKAIYRKYRPQTFSDVIDQQHVKITIQNQLASDTVAQAYLFTGPRGVGKTTIARLLAKSINCETRKEGEYEPCGTCSSCQAITEGRALDVIEIDAASNTGVDDVRNRIIENVRFVPNSAKKKVFIIDEVHMLSTSAFNALLKTIEEPPEHVVFILATTELHKVPQTIISRCQRFDFTRIAAGDLVQRLQYLAKEEGRKVDEPVLHTVARLSEGCLRDAESLLGQLFALEAKNITEKEAALLLPVTHLSSVVDWAELLSKGDVKRAIALLNEVVFQGGDMKYFTDELIEFVRTVLLLGYDAPIEDSYDKETVQRMRGILQRTTIIWITELLDALLLVRSRPQHEHIPQVPLEIVSVRYAFGGQVEGGGANVAPVQTPSVADSKEKVVVPESISQLSAKKAAVAPEVKEPVPPVVKESVAPEIPEEVEKVPVPEMPSVSEVPIENTVVEDSEEEDLTQGGEPRATFEAEELRSKWKRCCMAVSKRNVALPMVLDHAVVQDVQDGTAIIGFSHKFHFETMDNPKNVALLMEGINEIMQSNIKVEVIFLEEPVEKAARDLASEFGGEVL